MSNFDFTDLLVWKKAHQLNLSVYKLCRNLPNFEQYGLSNQIRRSVVSITSNSSEGFGRSSKKDKSHFYTIARASANEVHNQLILIKDLNYGDSLLIEKLIVQTIEVKKLIQSLINSTKTESSY